MDDVPPVLEPQGPLPPPPPRTSLAARLLNVFAMPGTVFDEVRTSPRALSNWLVPTLLLALITGCLIWMRLSEPALQQFAGKQKEALEQQVKAGRVTQVQADEVLAWQKGFFGRPRLLRCLGTAGAMVVSAGYVVWWSLLLWLLGRIFLKVRFPFSKALEAVGLTMMITVLGNIVLLLLMVNFSQTLSSFGGKLIFNDLETLQRSPVVAWAANAFSFWMAGVLSSALARLSGVLFPRAAFLVFACWLIQSSLLLLLAGSQLAL